MAQTHQRSVAYILLDHVDGKKEGKRGLVVNANPEIVNFLQGDLVVREPDHKQPSNPDYIAVQSFNHKGRYAVVPKEILGSLTEKQLYLLSTVVFASDRFFAYQNKHLQEAEYYDVHSKVIVTLPNHLEPTPGIVWYAGPAETLGGGDMNQSRIQTVREWFKPYGNLHTG